jgi:murein DD-endopeptidase MepM/ murein hydrolase activator NlpD
VIKVDARNAFVAIDHGSGLIGFYLHVYPIAVAQGSNVNTVTSIGSPSMKGGYATGCHIHLAFATYRGRSPAVGSWNPNSATWLRGFPALSSR